MGESSKNQISNLYVISAQLDKASLEKLKEMQSQLGLSRSRIIKMLIMNATVNANTPNVKTR